MPHTWRNMGPSASAGSLASWILTPRLAWQTLAPSVMAFVVIQMSIPKRAMSVSHTSCSR